jgi:hypothetical protein
MFIICGAVQIGIYSVFNDVDILKIMKINKLIWAGHVIRTENEL